MASSPKTPSGKSSRPRSSRGKSGKPIQPPAETSAGTPGFAETNAYFAPADFSGKTTSSGLPSLPALRASGPRPPMGGESLTDSLTALLTRPDERSERAKEILSRQPLMASHPIVSGGMPMFMP
ncbi:MAG: excinuclease ABC subunit UvrB, partial [Hyphomicrobium denitrificans]|nr:excinuclease ABC subunit UvrB [Hyphomicrobium denitrificans]